MNKLAEYAKFVSAAMALAGVIVSSGLLDGHTQEIVTTAISAVGAALVLLVPNAAPVDSTEG